MDLTRTVQQEKSALARDLEANRQMLEERDDEIGRLRRSNAELTQKNALLDENFQDLHDKFESQLASVRTDTSYLIDSKLWIPWKFDILLEYKYSTLYVRCSRIFVVYAYPTRSFVAIFDCRYYVESDDGEGARYQERGDTTIEQCMRFNIPRNAEATVYTE